MTDKVVPTAPKMVSIPEPALRAMLADLRKQTSWGRPVAYETAQEHIGQYLPSGLWDPRKWGI